MELKNKEWLDILGRIADYHGDPLIILDDSFEIFFSNQKANSLFSIEDFNITLEHVFEKSTVTEISDSIGIVLNSYQDNIFKDFSVKLLGGNSLSYDLSIEPFRWEETNNIILVFKNETKDYTDELLKKIKIGVSKDYSIKPGISLNVILTEIKNLSPFSIVSLRNVQSVIEKYEFPIWIKDANSKIICLNTAYANLLGVEESFAVGKKLETFLPSHQKAIYKLLDEYIFANQQQILLEGYGKKVDNFEVFQNIIQVPLLDNFSNIYAVVGLIVDNKFDYHNFWGAEDFNNEFIECFPNPIALLNSQGTFEKVNKRFGELLRKSQDELIDKRIEDIFPFFVTKNFSLFIQSDIKKDCIKLSNDYTPTDSSDFFVELFLIKIFDREKRVSNVLMTIDKLDDENKPEDELQYILTHRGKMFDILIQKNPEPIFIYDKENLKFLEVNNAAVKLYGYSRDEFLQMDLTDLYAPEDIQTLLDSFGDAASESRFSKPFRHRKKDGSNVLVEISKTSFNFNDREAHFNIVKDITSSFETEKQNQMLKAIFAETDLMVFTTDPSGFITFVNHIVSEKLGFTSAEILQSSFASLVVDDDRAIINTSIFQSHLEDPIVLETILKTSVEKNVDAEITATPILDFDGAVDSFTIIAKTQPVSILSDEPREVIKEVIKEVVVEKHDTVERKTNIPDSNFLSGMFHEILTPINVIIGFSQELISSTENPSEEQLEASDIINQNRIKMMDTMNSVVEYSDIIQNKFPLKLEDISITEVIEKLDNNIKDISGINDIQFAYGKISSSLKFRTDKQKFESFILSLIKVVARLSKDKKIYFSAFSIDDNSFVLGISDQYGNPSEYVANILEQVFENERDPKDFGLPKLTTYLSKTLLSFLGGKFYKSSPETLRRETGFLFPIESTATFVNQKYEPFQGSFTSANQSNDTNIIEEPNETPAETYEPLQEDIVRSTDKNNTQIDPTENESDIFKPILPVPEEIISHTVEEIHPEDLDYEDTSEVESTDENIVVESAVVDSENTELQNENNITEEIKKEFDTEVPIEQEPALPKSLDLSKLNCLYIEDQIDSQILFKVQMKGLNDVKFAVSFEEAQLLLLNHQFDFIIMDINLQGEYNGLDALKIIKTMPAFSSIPIVAVTAYVLPGDKEKFIAAGFDDFISKPIFKEKMMESLEKIFLSNH